MVPVTSFPLLPATCSDCKQPFTIAEAEKKFLAKISPAFNGKVFPIPLPSQCAACREASRLSFRNEWKMYHRVCDFSGKQVISIYSEDSPYKVYDQAVWWSDDYDPLVYGREFDFSRPFFEQFHELNLQVPKLSIQNAKSENSQYTNYSWGNKNSYLAVGCSECEDCYYCYRVTSSKNICDSYDLTASELCYQCIQGSNLYACVYTQNCHDSANLVLCVDCRGCSDCYNCSGLRNAKFCIDNQQLNENEYRAQLKAIRSGLSSSADYEQKLETLPEPESLVVNCEDCSGDFLINCSRCYSAFSLKESQDCLYVGNGERNVDSVDCNFTDKNELQYYSTNLTQNYRVLFCALVWFTSDSMYLTNCFHSQSLFGCTGMKKNKYCVLNKQYSEGEYHKLCAKIAEHMKETGEWGKFFPASISPFPYNTSIAHEYYPMTKAEAVSKGLQWQDDIPSVSAAKSQNMPNVKVCKSTNKAFRCTPAELLLYETLDLPTPDLCPELRHSNRMDRVKRAIVNYL